MIRYPILEKDLIAQIKERIKPGLAVPRHVLELTWLPVNTPAVLSSGAR